MKNERYPREKAELIACKRDEVIKDLIALEVPFFSKDISEKKMEFDGKMEENYDFKRNFSFGEKLCFEVVAKAMNILKISMREVKLFNPDFKSKKEFYESFLRNLKFNFDKRQNFKKENQLELAKFILQNFKSALMKEQKQSYEVSNFEARELEETGVRSIFTSKKIQDSKYEWLYYTKWSKDSGLEEKFLGFIDERAHMIDEKFGEWIILRNDGFEEFKIYDNRKELPTYGMGFEPDFIFFGKRKGEKNNHLSVECIMESKGEHLMDDEKGSGKDQWKENLLKALHQRQFDIKLNEKFEVLTLPFYSVKKKAEFETAFRKIFENSLFKEG